MFLAPVSLSTQLLSTGACRFLFMWRGHMSVYRCFTKTRRREMWDENLLFESGSKHPADVPFKKSSGHVRHIKCPHALKTFLKSATHFLNRSQMSDINSLRLKQFAKTPVTDIPPQHKHRSHRESTECRCGKNGTKMYGSQGWQIVIK